MTCETQIPKPRRGRLPKWKKYFDSCEVGESFFIPEDYASQKGMGSTLAYWNKKMSPKHFVSRRYGTDGSREEKEGKNGCRVWRDA